MRLERILGVLGMSFKNVKFVNLGSITKWTSGGTPSKKNKDFWDGRIPWISARNLKSNFVYSSDITISELGLNNGSRLAPVKSILLLVRGSGLFNDIPIGLVEKEVAFNQDLKCIQADSETVLPEYIFYWLLGSKQLLRSILEVTGIGAGKFDTKLLQNLEIPLPSIEEQELIVKLCDSISRKIEINERISQLLENIAQVIFKQWFVDFEFPNEDSEPYKSSGGEMVESELGLIPKGWEVKELGEIIDIHDSKRIPLSKKEREKREKKYPYYGAASLMDYVDEFIFDGTYVLLGEDGTVVNEDGSPVLQYVWGKFWVNNHAHVLSGKKGISTNFLYILLSNLNVSGAITGAVQLKINQKNLKEMKIIMPNDMKLVSHFSDIVDKSFEKIRVKRDENKNLVLLRDSLLPKLMSGEIRVPLDEEGDVS